MKEIDFIISENVVNIESPKKINNIGEHFYDDNNAVLLTAIDQKNHYNSKKIKAVNHSGVFNKNFEVFVFCATNTHDNKFNKISTIYKAMPREISIRINN